MDHSIRDENSLELKITIPSKRDVFYKHNTGQFTAFETVMLCHREFNQWERLEQQLTKLENQVYNLNNPSS